LVLSLRKENQIATDSRKGQEAKRKGFAAGADGNWRDRLRFIWRGCVLAQAALFNQPSGREESSVMEKRKF
jgi:hypothetical protein